jgi:hypothetical protein
MQVELIRLEKKAPEYGLDGETLAVRQIENVGCHFKYSVGKIPWTTDGGFCSG